MGYDATISPYIPYMNPAQTNLLGAQTANTQANTGLLGEQTQAADIANQNAALNLQLYKQALSAPPIGNPNAVPGGNLLGAIGGSTPPTGTTPNTAPSTSDAGNISPDHPADYPSPADLLAHAQAKYAPTVQPFTPDERVQVMQGLASPNPYIKQRTQAFVDARTSAMNADNAQKGQDAIKDYNTMADIASRDDGTAFGTLQRINAQGAKAIAAQHPEDFTTDSMGNAVALPKGEADAKSFAASTAGNIHPWTGRGIDTTPAGVVIDKVDGKPVTGVNQITNLGGKEIADIAARGHAKVDTFINGQPAQQEQWQIDRAPDYSTWLQTQLNQATRGIQQGAAPTSAQQSPSPGGSMPGAAPPKTATGASQPNAPGAPTASNPANALQNGLPGVDITALPKREAVSIPQGQSASADQKAQMERDNTQTAAQLQAASESSANDAKMRSLLNQANGELAKINPRTVGPGSDFYNSYLKFKAGVTGGSPSDLVDEQELDKFLNQVGAQNVRTLLSGQKITNQEMMTFMTRGSPNTEQSVQTIKNLVNYLGADNDYDSRLQATKIAALKKGADPWSINDALETASPRTNYIQGRTGMALRGPGQTNPSAPPPAGKTVTRTGMQNGRKVVQYSDGSMAYAQ